MSIEFKFHETYENRCIHDSKSIGAFYEEVLIDDPRFRVRARHCGSTNRMKYRGGDLPYIIVNICVRCRKEVPKGGNNIIGPCGGSNKSFHSPDGFPQREDIELSSQVLGVDERLVERISGL